MRGSCKWIEDDFLEVSEVMKFLESVGMSSFRGDNTAITYQMQTSDGERVSTASIYKDILSIGVSDSRYNTSVDATVLLSIPTSMDELFYLLKRKAEDSAANFSFEERKTLDYFLELLHLNE
ncbi:MAG TPA: hypothetical protein VI933_02870 [archaeon]|nr:hypothetical protein [archaeon]